MDLITQFPLGDDLAVTLLVLGLLAVAALVAGAVVPTRPRRDEDSAEVDPTLGRRLGAPPLSSASILLWVGRRSPWWCTWPPAGPTTASCARRCLLVGLALGPLAAWRGLAIQLAALGVDPERRGAMLPRLGALTVAGALALAAAPVVIAVWFLQTTAGPALIALAAGAAISALVVRASAAPVEAGAAAAAVLVGTDEHELDVDDEDNLGGPHLRKRPHGAPRRGPRRRPRRRRDRRRRPRRRARRARPRGRGLRRHGCWRWAPRRSPRASPPSSPMRAARATSAVRCAAGRADPLRARRRRRGRRCGAVDPLAVQGPPLRGRRARELHRSRDHRRHRHAARATRAADRGARRRPEPVHLPDGRLAVRLRLPRHARPLWHHPERRGRRGAGPRCPRRARDGARCWAAPAIAWAAPSPRAARTSRTGGALGLTAGLGSSALTAAGALALVVLIAAVLSVLAAGVPSLALALAVHAGLGALIVVAGHAGPPLASTPLDRAGAESGSRRAAGGIATGPLGALLLAAVLIGLGALGPVVSALRSPRAPRPCGRTGPCTWRPPPRSPCSAASPSAS
ncbi:hypothetical protein [Brachybacterium sp. GPGPB12]|uniref:hypothetical protein n=1 Tax=Brachybacterium sp. GPGPB12 TaxID=3023517 RepID=UPI0031343A60